MSTISVPIIIRNAVQLRYPLSLVVRSVVGLANEIVISVDPSSVDDTMDLVYDIMLEVNSENPGLVKCVESPWDLSHVTSTGEEFSRQTNIAIDACRCDWVFSIQADEGLFEEDFDRIRGWVLRDGVDAYSTERLYFYGDIDTIRWDWTHPIVRLFRRGSWKSCGDGMNSESCGGSAPVTAPFKIYHYSRIGDPEILSKRILSLDRFFHPAEKLAEEKDLKPYEFETYNFDCMHKPEVDVGRKRVKRNFGPYSGPHPKPFIGYKG